MRARVYILILLYRYTYTLPLPRTASPVHPVCFSRDPFAERIARRCCGVRDSNS